MFMRKNRPLFYGAVLMTACSAATPVQPVGTDSGTALDGGVSSDAGAALWPVGAKSVLAIRSGGFFAAQCRLSDGGTLFNSTWTLDLQANSAAFAACDYSVKDGGSLGPTLRIGQRPLSAQQLADFDAAMKQLKVSGRSSCGADAPELVLQISTAGPALRYQDDFYSGCLPAAGTTFVENMGQVFSVLQMISAP
jgi:hypothetical protein